MSTARVLRGSYARIRRPLLVTLPFLLCTAAPLESTSAQAPSTSAEVQPLRTFGELQLLGGQADGGPAFSGRALLQRRRSLGSSLTFAGLLLQDDLSHTAGLAVGHAWSFPSGRFSFEPFGEIGGGLTDARVHLGSYDIVEPGGALRTLDRYRAVEGPAVIGGAGLSVSTLMAGASTARLTAGYWHVAGADGLSRGGVRLGLSLGMGRRNGRWYSLATDRTPPELLFPGLVDAGSDSVDVAGGTLSLSAADANGVARVEIDGRALELAPPREIGGHVVATLPMEAPFGGRGLDVVVRDSAGLETHRRVRAFGAPDREPPVVTLLDLTATTGAPGWAFSALATDFSGIAEARIGVCTVPVSYPNPVTHGTGHPVTARIVGGWQSADAGTSLLVVDRSGNEARIAVPSQGPAVGSAAPMPTLSIEFPFVAALVGSSRSVLVRGAVRDAARGWIRSVTVDGTPAPLRFTGDPSDIAFEGWVSLPSTRTAVGVVATTWDGRTVRATGTVPPESADRMGRLHVIVARPETSGHEDWARIAELAGEADRDLLLGGDATSAALVDALVRARSRARPEDVVLIHVSGALVADSTAPGASIALSGGDIRVDYLNRLVRALEPAASMLAYDLRPGALWRPPLAYPPGAPPAAGCLEDAMVPAGRAVDLGVVDGAALLAALQGGADRDLDGLVRVHELLEALGVGSSSGLVSARPDAVVTAGGDR